MREMKVTTKIEYIDIICIFYHPYTFKHIISIVCVLHKIFLKSELDAIYYFMSLQLSIIIIITHKGYFQEAGGKPGQEMAGEGGGRCRPPVWMILTSVDPPVT